jgi:hypothetical protein
MAPPGAAMVVKPHGTKRFTPAALAALASADCAALPKLSTALMMVWKGRRTLGSMGAEVSMARKGKPPDERARVEGLERDWGRTMRVMSLGC